MILIDANLLIYASFKGANQHEAAKTWLEEYLNSSIRIGLPWASLLAFVRIGTNPRVFERPLSVERATAQVNDWLDLANVWTPETTPQHGTLLTKLLSEVGTGGNLVTDAHLASLSIEHGLKLCSTDRDFAKFKGLNWENPLDAA